VKGHAGQTIRGDPEGLRQQIEALDVEVVSQVFQMETRPAGDIEQRTPRVPSSCATRFSSLSDSPA